MSIAYETIRCTKCDYKTGSHILWGECVYEIKGVGKINMQQRLGWCGDCMMLAPVEDLRPRKLDSTKDNSNSFHGIIADVAKKHSQLHQTLIGLRLITAKAHRREVVRQSNALGGAVHELQTFLYKSAEVARFNEIIASRKSPAKCLKCASTKILFCDLPDSTADGKIIELENVHPNCGGNFTVLSNGNRIALDFNRIRIYSFDGIFLREVELNPQQD